MSASNARSSAGGLGRAAAGMTDHTATCRPQRTGAQASDLFAVGRDRLRADNPLPEKIGGVRNWDYRYCWLRDASLTLRALCELGFEIEAESFLSWLLHATHLTWPNPRMVYGVYGEPHLPERELTHLTGYAGSRPVR